MILTPSTFRRLTTFEQVLVSNSIVIVISTLATFEVTRITLEPYHYVLDMVFVSCAILVGVGLNMFLLKNAFRPLFAMLQTIQAIQHGHAKDRVRLGSAPAEIEMLAAAFNFMLDSIESSQQAALRDIAQAQEKERRRIALELHDATGQELMALTLKLTMVNQDIEDVVAMFTGAPQPQQTVIINQFAQIEQQIATTIQMVQRTMGGVRALSQQLRPSILDDIGLVAALQWLVKELADRTPGKILVSADDYVRRLPPLIEIILFRVAQEALTNALRHSQAQQIAIAIRHSVDCVTITIEDNGIGFSQTTGYAGIGIRGMRERIVSVGGHYQIASAPGNGTTIVATVPLVHQAMTVGAA